ncbi:hypothetical protein NDU88_005029 [Pleurodeles waltl]|uniref:Uncharacterized protein n=1 Tax=Pleurodeles waltl TaxID=8319 RepID=A0AAV7M832_PLEWA|nr:hypothetical protein NDU88_005029 [Pleurodeles waltl]
MKHGLKRPDDDNNVPRGYRLDRSGSGAALSHPAEESRSGERRRIVINAGVYQAEQRVSDLEDAQSRFSTTTDKMQADLEALQQKLDDYENRSRRSDLRLFGIPEELGATSSITEVISDLTYKYVLPEKATANVDLSTMLAHRVTVTRILTAKYPQTIRVNFGDYRIKDQVFSQAIRTKLFNPTDNFNFCILSDLSAKAAH